MQDRPIGSGHDPVVWYCFGITHVVRPEDFPVMPVEKVLHLALLCRPTLVSNYGGVEVLLMQSGWHFTQLGSPS